MQAPSSRMMRAPPYPQSNPISTHDLVHTVHIVPTLRAGRICGKWIGQHAGVTHKLSRN